MRLNQIKFAENGGCGYLLKPKILRDPNFNPKKIAEEQKPTHLLTIKVICAEHLPKSPDADKNGIVTPYISFSILGLEAENKQKTKTIRKF